MRLSGPVASTDTADTDTGRGPTLTTPSIDDHQHRRD